MQTIEATLNSILKQTYRPLEYVLVDGLSKDGTVEMIESYIPKFLESGIEVQFISEKDSGIYNAMNKGIKLCTGDIIGILNSDDIYVSDQIVEEIAQKFNPSEDALEKSFKTQLTPSLSSKERGKRECGEIEVVYGDLLLSNNGKVYREIKGRVFEEVTGFNVNDMKFNHPTMFVCSTVYEKVGYFDEKFRIAADKDLVVRMIQNKIRFIKLEKPITIMDIGGETGRTRKIKEIIEAMQEGWRIGKNNHFGFIPTLWMCSRSLKYRVLAYTKYHLFKMLGKE